MITQTKRPADVIEELLFSNIGKKFSRSELLDLGISPQGVTNAIKNLKYRGAIYIDNTHRKKYYANPNYSKDDDSIMVLQG